MTVWFDRDRGQWRCKFQIAKKTRSFYCVDPVTHAPATTRTEAKDIRDALRAAAKRAARQHAAAPIQATPGVYTLAQAVAAWIPTVKGGANWKTRATHVAELLQYFGPERALDEIGDVDVQGYIAFSRAQPRLVYLGGPRVKAKHAGKPRALWKPYRDGRTRTDATTNRYLDALRGVLQLAHATRDPTAKPARPLLPFLVAVPYLDEPERLPRPIPSDVLRRLLEILPPHAADALALTLAFSLRKNEAHRIERDWIDWDNNGLWLPPELTKADRAEFLPGNVDAMALLRRLDEAARGVGMARLIWWRGPAKKNGAHTGKPRAVASTRTAWETALARLGLAGRYTFHNTKAAYVTALAKGAAAAGVPARGVQELARHKSFETTQRYLLVVDAQRRAAVDAMAGLLPTRSGSSRTPTIAHAPEKNSRTPRKRLKRLASPG